MKRTLFMFLVCLMSMGQAMASDVLTVENMTLPQNTDAVISINGEFDTQFKGFQLDVELGGGLTLVLDTDNKPVGELGFTGTDHSISSSVISEGHYRFIVVSMSNKLVPQSGTLLKVYVSGASGKTVGESFNASVTNIEFTTASTEVQNLSDADFTITIGEPADTRTVLDEKSTTAPAAATGVDVRVKRTINANEWSTICLPFAMTNAQVKNAFGDDVELADFSSWSSEEDSGGNIVAITVGFTPVTTIEANHPYIIKVSSAITEFTVDGVDIDPEEEPTNQVGVKKSERGYMIGTYEANFTVPDEDVFLSGGKFWYSKGLTKMMGFRAYFEFADVLTIVEGPSNAPAFNMTIGGKTTKIPNIITESDDDLYYNLKGQHVDNPTKGLYIKNGKKVVIK